MLAAGLTPYSAVVAVFWIMVKIELASNTFAFYLECAILYLRKIRFVKRKLISKNYSILTFIS